MPLQHMIKSKRVFDTVIPRSVDFIQQLTKINFKNTNCNSQLWLEASKIDEDRNALDSSCSLFR